MNKLASVFYLFLFISSGLYAQKNAIETDTVVKTSQELTFIALHNSQPLSGLQLKAKIGNLDYHGSTDVKGEWILKLPSNAKTAAVSCKSKFYYLRDTVVNLNAGKLIKLYLKERTSSLSELKVVESRTRVKGNALEVTYKIDPRSISVNTMAGDALCQTPTIFMGEGQAFYILGNDKAASIFIDGIKASRLDLDDLQASQIDRIVTMPDVGEGGVIRIYTKRASHAQLNGNLQAGASVLRKILKGYGSLSYKSDKLYFKIQANQYSSFGAKTRSKTITRIENLSDTYESEGKQNQFQSNLNFKLKWTPSDRVNLWWSTSYFGLSLHEDMAVKSQTLEERSRYITNYNLVNNYFTLNYKYSSKHRFGLRALHLYLVEGAEERVRKEYESKSEFNNLSVNLYYLLNNKVFNMRSQSFLAYTYTNRTTFGNKESFPQDLHTYKYHLALIPNDKLSLSLALILEQASFKGLQRSFTDFLPYAAVAYNLGKSRLSLSYKKAVMRPIHRQLVSLPFYETFTYYIAGNEKLKSSSSDRWAFRWGREIAKTHVNYSGSFLQENNLIGVAYKNDLINGQYHNIGRLQQWSHSLGLMRSFINGKLSTNLNLTATYHKYTSYPNLQEYLRLKDHAGWAYSCNTYVSYAMSPTVYLSGDLFWLIKRQSYEGEDQCPPFYNLSVNKSFLNNKLTVTLSFSDLFVQHATRHRSFIKNGIKNSRYYTESQNISISLKYRFGKQFQELYDRNQLGLDDVTYQ